MGTINQQMLHHLNQDGFSVVMVGGGADDGDDAPFSYSVGFRTIGHPDIIIPGLPGARAADFIGQLHASAKAGTRRTPGVAYNDVASGYLAQFRSVLPQWRQELMPLASLAYRHINGDPNFTALQLFYPDRFGRWPWDPAVAPALRQMQPRLDLDPQPPRYAGDRLLRAVRGAGIAVA